MKGLNQIIVSSLMLLLLNCASTHAASSAGKADKPDPLVDADALELFEMGYQFANRGDLVRAEQYLSAAIARGYPANRALPALIRICISESRLGAALKYAEPYLRQHPQEWRLRFIVSSVLLALGQADRARVELDRVIKESPNHAPSHYLLGVIYRDEYDDRDSARRHFTRYLEIQPDGLHGAEVRSWLEELGPANSPAQWSAGSFTEMTL
ncbi:MAG: tetratricopeptide repeat protein [Deltaproteobacteria bacterium]|nr:tetratricopeptide repeat protein [Deltaproteobacteria bacterium]